MVQFSFQEFFERCPSLWRWVKYGHDHSTYYVNPFSKESLTAPSAPFVKERIERLITHPLTLPSILHNRALRFLNSSKHFSAYLNAMDNYPGDGYIFFMDPYFGGNCPRFVSKTTFHFFNFLYSYRHLISPASFEHLAGLRSESLIQVLYEYRSCIFKNTSFFSALDEFCKTKRRQKEFDFFLLSRLLGRTLENTRDASKKPAYLQLNQIITLLEAYTIEAVRRIMFSPHAVRRRIINYINLVNETRSLINGPLPCKYTSPAALQRFHDAQAERLSNIAREKEPNLFLEYEWPCELVKLIDEFTKGEWYIPVRRVELKTRGQIHHNCVGAYVERHFHEPKFTKHVTVHAKTLILLSGEAEAEIQIFLQRQDSTDKSTGKNCFKIVCIGSTLAQCKTRFNAFYSSPILKRLCDVFKGMDARLFMPSLKK